jgi:CYTH domain-containing protein
MGKEIERRFLVSIDEKIVLPQEYQNIYQGFLSIDSCRIVRIRTVDLNNGQKWARITIKGKKNEKGSGVEFEYSIPYEEAQEIMKLAQYTIRKKRYEIFLQPNKQMIEIDVFQDENEGLIIAEIELQNEDEKLKLPESWKEITSESSVWSNLALAMNPYKRRNVFTEGEICFE